MYVKVKTGLVCKTEDSLNKSNNRSSTQREQQSSINVQIQIYHLEAANRHLNEQLNLSCKAVPVQMYFPGESAKLQQYKSLLS